MNKMNKFDGEFFDRYGGLPVKVKGEESVQPTAWLLGVVTLHANMEVCDSPYYAWVGDDSAEYRTSPVPFNQKVRVQMRDGMQITAPAGELDWDGDIIAFKLLGK